MPHKPRETRDRRDVFHASDMSTASDSTHTLEALCGQTPIFLVGLHGRNGKLTMKP